MTAALIPEPPLLVLPSLAEEVGLNEAIVLQQLHYWTQKKDIADEKGEVWVYNTISAWHEQFPFWGRRTIKRVIGKLRETGLIEVRQSAERDRTNHYRLVYDALPMGPKWPHASGQSGPFLYSSETTNRETPCSSPKSSSGSSHAAEIREVFDYWRERHSPRAKLDAKRKKRIGARLHEGFDAAQLKRAIDGAGEDEWLNGSTPGSPGYLKNLLTILRDAEQVERLEELVHKAASEESGFDEVERRSQAAEEKIRKREERMRKRRGGTG